MCLCEYVCSAVCVCVPAVCALSLSQRFKYCNVVGRLKYCVLDVCFSAVCIVLLDL